MIGTAARPCFPAFTLPSWMILGTDQLVLCSAAVNKGLLFADQESPSAQEIFCFRSFFVA